MVNNQHLVEVLCAIRFDPNQNEWDSTFFGKYHELIKKRGFSEKREQKQVEFQVELKPVQSQSVLKEGQGQIKMVFSNPEEKSAIIMTDNFISFHKLAPYHTWGELIEKVALPSLTDYYSIGLGKSIIEVQCLYLNKYLLQREESLTNYFNFFPIIPESIETQVAFQGKYDLDLFNFVQLKLNTTLNETGKDIFFECSSFSNVSAEKEDFLALAQKAHDNANNAYNAIINK